MPNLESILETIQTKLLMKTITPLLTNFILCLFVAINAFGMNNAEMLDIKDIYLQQRAEQFAQQKTNNNNIVMFRTSDQDVTQLPYYNYNGIQDLVEAKLAWYEDQSTTTYENTEQLVYSGYNGIADLEEAKIAYANDHGSLSGHAHNGVKGEERGVACQCAYDNAQFGSPDGLVYDGIPHTLTTCLFGGEYRVVTGVIAGVPITFETCGDTDWDTQISVYEAGGGVCLDGNDDFCGLQSSVTVVPTSTSDLDILLDQFFCSSNTSCMTLNYTAESTIPPPVNNLCVDAIEIVCGETVSGTTLGATIDGVPFCGTSNTAPGVWYTFEAGPGPASLTTCGGFFDYDTKISVFTDGCGTLTCIDGNDDQCVGGANGLLSTVDFVAAGGTYLVLVHGFGTASGDFELTLNCTEPCSELTMNCAPDVSVSNDEGECGAVVLLTPPSIPCCEGSGTSTGGVGEGGSIPDGTGGCNGTSGAPLESIITIADGSGTVTNVSIEVDMTHTWVGDLVIDLTSSDLTTLRVLETVGNAAAPGGGGCGCSSDILSPVSFFDGSANDAATVEATCGTVWPITEGDPVDPFSAFNGESVNGDWTLSIRDYSGADVGTLFSWTITIDYGSPKTGGSQTITKTNVVTPVEQREALHTAMLSSASTSQEEKEAAQSIINSSRNNNATPMSLEQKAAVQGLMNETGLQLQAPASNRTNTNNYVSQARGIDCGWNQLFGFTEESSPASQMDPTYPFDAPAADDFSVPAGETWDINLIEAFAVYFNVSGGGCETGMRIIIYNNDGNTFPTGIAPPGPYPPPYDVTNCPGGNCPGTIVFAADYPVGPEFAVIPLGGDDVAYVVTPAAPINLPSGDYWLTVQPIMPFGGCAQVAWKGNPGPPVNGSPGLQAFDLLTIPYWSTSSPPQDLAFNIVAECVSNGCTLTNDAPADNFYEVGSTTVTWTVIDENGNSATCEQIVTVTDDEPPTIPVCPPDLTVEGCLAEDITNDGQTALPYSPGLSLINSAQFTAEGGTWADNCTPQQMIQYQDVAAGTFPEVVTRTFTVTDEGGNTVTCEQTITLVELPTLTCGPNPPLVTNEPGLCGANITVISPEFTCCDETREPPNGDQETKFSMGPNPINQMQNAEALTEQEIQDQMAKILSPEDLIAHNEKMAIYNELVANGEIEVNPSSYQGGGMAYLGNVCDASPALGVPHSAGNGSRAGDPNLWDFYCFNGTAGDVVTIDVDRVGGGMDPIAGLWSGFGTDATGISLLFGGGGSGNAELIFVASGDDDECNGVCDCFLDPLFIATLPVTGIYTIGVADFVGCGPPAYDLTTTGISDCSPCGEPEPPVCVLTNDFNGTDDASGFYPVGVTTVTWTLTDPAGNSATCEQTVTVIDIEPPIVTCPEDITVDNDPGECGAIVNYTPTATDNCEIADLIVYPLSGSFFELGTTLVQVVAIDVNGLASTCSFNVTVNDNEPPVVTCPEDITQSNDPGECGAIVDFTPTATDNCPGVIVVSVPPSGSFFDVGTTTVTVTALDLAGNSDVCTFEVTVEDDEAPGLVCPEEIIVSSEPGLCEALVCVPQPEITDNCLDEDPESTNTIMFRTADQDVSKLPYYNYNGIQDLVEAKVAWLSAQTENSRLGVPQSTATSANTEQLVYRGYNGIANLEEAKIAWLDAQPQSTTTYENTEQLVYSGYNGIADLEEAKIAYANDHGSLSGHAHNGVKGEGYEGSCACPNDNVAFGTTALVYDGSLNNATTCIFGGEYRVMSGVLSGVPITFETCSDPDFDTQIMVYDAVTGLCLDGNDDFCGLQSSVTVFPTSTNNLNIVIDQFFCTSNSTCMTLDYTAGEPAGAPVNDLCVDAIEMECGETVSGTTLGSTWDSMGFCGTANTAGGVWYRFVATGPTATISTCNQASYDTKISVFEGGCAVLTCVGGQDDAAGCAGFSTELTVPTTSGTEYWVLVHGFGTATGDFDLTLTCPQPVPVPVNDLCADAIPILCGETVLGTTTGSTWDDMGFCGTDNTAPGVWYTFEAGPGPASVTTCGAGTNYDTKLSVFTGDCENLVCVGGNDDDFGCAFSFLRSTFDFVATGGTYYVLVHGFGTATGDFELTLNCEDPCSNPPTPPGFTIVNDYNGTDDATDIYDVGTTTVTWTVTDASGNSSTCTVDVTVEDNEDPVVTCPANITNDNDPGQCGAIVEFTPTATDNCGVTISSVPASGSFFVVGTTEVTVTATDESGNSDVCTFDVTINDVESPIITCPQDITGDGCVVGDVLGVSGLPLALVPTPVDVLTFIALGGTYSDNCSSPTESSGEYVDLSTPPGVFPIVVIRTFILSDAVGNAAGCTQIITIEDTTNPIAVCEDVTLFLNQSGNATLYPIMVGGNSTDNCIKRKLTLDKTLFGCDDVGENTVTLTVIDQSGNTATCTATVTVVDDWEPNVICMDASVSLDPNGTVTITPALIDNGTYDACGIDTMFVVPSEFDLDDIGPNGVALIAFDVNGNIGFCFATVTILPPVAIPIDDDVEAADPPSNNSAYQTETDWVVYPNPTSSQLSITNSTDQDIDQLWVVDITGKQVSPTIISKQSSSYVIDVSQFATGVYFVLIQSGDTQEALRFIKQ